MREPNFDVFLSHNSVDKPWVTKLKGKLVELGLSVWLDKDEIRPGDFFAEALEKGLRSSRAVALIVSPASMKSGWVKEEYYSALSLAKDAKVTLQLIPVILLDASLPGFLQCRQWVDFRDPKSFDVDVLRLYYGITGRKYSEGKDATNGSLGTMIRQPQCERTVATVFITLDRDFDSFTETDNERLLELIKASIDSGAVARITGVQRGSVKLTLQLDTDRPDRILDALKGIELKEFGLNDARIKIPQTLNYPYRTVCHLEMTQVDGSKLQATGFLVGRRTVLTAGQNLFRRDCGWMKEIVVTPGKNGDNAPLGSWKASRPHMLVSSAWEASERPDCNFGAILLYDPIPSDPVGDRVGWIGLQPFDDQSLMGMEINVLGYQIDQSNGTNAVSLWGQADRIAKADNRFLHYASKSSVTQVGGPVFALNGGVAYAAGICLEDASTGRALRINSDIIENIKQFSQ